MFSTKCRRVMKLLLKENMQLMSYIDILLDTKENFVIMLLSTE